MKRRGEAAKKEREVKQAVTKRMHLTSLPEVVEEMMGQLPRRLMDCGDDKVRETFRAWLTHLSETLTFQLAMDFQSAAKRGIEEAANLVQDPDYYETVKKRRRAAREQGERWRQEAQEREAMRERHRRGEYTQEERERMIAATKSSIDYHDKMLRAERDKLLSLESGKALLEDVQLDWGDADF